jgi:aspartyl-tRNA(Asn)/glutamyl-tRNA(Gln) amidotransferase subunit C
MIDQKTIQHMAKLARLQLNDEQAKKYSEQMSTILNHFEQISQVNTQGVEPMITPSEIENFWREDEVIKENSAEDMLKNAPARTGNLFKVPPVVG